MLAVTVFSLLVTGIIGVLIYAQQSTAIAGASARASFLAEEGLEAVRNIRDEQFTNLTDGTFGLAIVANKWALAGASDTTDIFTRQIIISSIDNNRKSVTVNVTWQQNLQRAGSLSLVTRLSNWTKKGPVSFIAALSGAGTSITIPAHQIGDLLVIFAYKDGGSGAPSLPAGWTTVGNSGGSANASRLAYRVATATNDPSGTWTNATALVVQIYRGQNSVNPIGANAEASAVSTTVTYPALTLSDTSGASWVAGFAGHRSINTTLETPPTGMVNRTDFVDATDEVASHDTNTGVSFWAATNVSVGGTSSGWRARTLEILSN